MRSGLRVTGNGLRVGTGETGTNAALSSHTPTRHPSPVTRCLRAAMALAIAVSALSGCSDIKPWVKPYERAAFADPIMAANPNPVSGSYINHVHEAREGARGATGVAGGGCGCN